MCGIFHDFPYDGWFAAGHQTSISPIQAADCPDGMAVSYLKCDGRRGPLRSVGYLLELLEMWIFVSSFVTNSSSHQQPSAAIGKPSARDSLVRHCDNLRLHCGKPLQWQLPQCFSHLCASMAIHSSVQILQGRWK